MSTASLVAIATWIAETGARTVVFFKICPALPSATALLLLVASCT